MKKLILTALLPLTLLAGCQTQQVRSPDYPQLVFGQGAKSFLAIDSLTDGYTEGHLLRVSIQAVNASSSSKTLRYKFTWFDEAGFEINSLTSRWEALETAPHEPITINRLATSPKAVSYKVFLSDAHAQSPQPQGNNR
ncbi:YcfL family protein [Amphritea opalescens]|nr:YcfL family protein [Amphritea opalescens]